MPKKQIREVKPKCKNCYGKGFATVAYGGSKGTQVYKKFCTCPKGKRLAKLERKI